MKQLILFFTVALFGINVHAQSTIYINLAENEGVIDTVEISTFENVNYQLVNTLPTELKNRNYIITEEHFYVPVAPLDGSGYKLGEKKDSLVQAPPCSDSRLLSAIQHLQSLTDENAVPETVIDLNKAIIDAGPGCTDEIDIATTLIERTKSPIYSTKLKDNYDLRITIIRYGADGKVRKWTTLIKNQKKGEWRTTYGFTFAHDTFKQKETFYSQQTDSVYTISKGNSNNKLDYIPTVYFIWQRYTSKPLSIGFLSGIGIEEDKPAVTLGAILNFRENIGIALGLTAHQKQKLLGQYTEGQIIRESLTEEQLHEDVWGLSPSISISFRFKSSPFGS